MCGTDYPAHMRSFLFVPRLFTKYTRNVREDFATYLYSQTNTALDDESSATDLLLAASFDQKVLMLG